MMFNPVKKKKPLGELLLEAGLITKTDLAQAVAKLKESNMRMGELLVKLKMVTEFDIVRTLTNQLGVEYIHLETASIDPEAIALVPEKIAKKYLCIPVTSNKQQISLAMADPLDYECIKDIGFKSELEVLPLISTRKEILNAIKQNYDMSDSLEEILHASDNKQSSFIEIQPVSAPVQVAPSEDLKKKSQMAPIVRMFNLVLMKAIRTRASDIHFDPQKANLLIRFRVDGILQNEMTLPKWAQSAIVSRIKILASLDISERRLPQDGAIRVKLDERDIDLRVSTLPTHYGEKVVIRILDQSSVLLGLDRLGFSEKDLEKMRQMCQKRQGILLVTGPTGSGKTSTLYALINMLRSETVNIMTVEDPIKYDIDGLNQVQVNPDIGLTFAIALRSILRQDPNVVMIGEIRDLKTAEIAFRAAMTGHLVISTVHTNDAPATITRLIDMGIPRYIVSSTLVGIIAQRLVRKICVECKVDLSSSENEQNGAPQVVRGKGCPQCHQTGFRGRIGTFEVLPIEEKIKEVIALGGSDDEIRHVAEDQGLSTMAEDGLSKVYKGITTLEEVQRVVEVVADIVRPCPECQGEIHADFMICPHCKYDIQSKCAQCKKKIKATWLACAYCKTEIVSVTKGYN